MKRCITAFFFLGIFATGNAYAAPPRLWPSAEQWARNTLEAADATPAEIQRATQTLLRERPEDAAQTTSLLWARDANSTILIDALRVCSQRGNDRACGVIALEIWKNSRDSQLLIAVMQTLEQQFHVDPALWIHDALHHPVERVRLIAIQLSAEIWLDPENDKKLRQRLHAQLLDPTTYIQHAAIVALAARGPGSEGLALAAYLDNPDPDLRRASAHALGRLRTEGTQHALFRCASQNGDIELASICAESLANFGDAVALRYLETILFDVSPEQISENTTLRALARVREPTSELVQRVWGLYRAPPGTFTPRFRRGLQDTLELWGRRALVSGAQDIGAGFDPWMEEFTDSTAKEFSAAQTAVEANSEKLARTTCDDARKLDSNQLNRYRSIVRDSRSDEASATDAVLLLFASNAPAPIEKIAISSVTSPREALIFALWSDEESLPLALHQLSRDDGRFDWALVVGWARNASIEAVPSRARRYLRSLEQRSTNPKVRKLARMIRRAPDQIELCVASVDDAGRAQSDTLTIGQAWSLEIRERPL